MRRRLPVVVRELGIDEFRRPHGIDNGGWMPLPDGDGRHRMIVSTRDDGRMSVHDARRFQARRAELSQHGAPPHHLRQRRRSAIGQKRLHPGTTADMPAGCARGEAFAHEVLARPANGRVVGQSHPASGGSHRSRSMGTRPGPFGSRSRIIECDRQRRVLPRRARRHRVGQG